MLSLFSFFFRRSLFLLARRDSFRDEDVDVVVEVAEGTVGGAFLDAVSDSYYDKE